MNLVPRTSSELVSNLRRFRRKFEVLSLICTTKDVARHAARDRRVDLLQFSVTNLRKRFFDEAEAELASQAFSSLEIEMAPLLRLTGASRVRLLSRLRREVVTAEKCRVPITISSGATDEYLMRGPHDYAALTTLFDLPLSSALKALSENPCGLVERNREKLSPEYVAPGIRVVGRKGGA
jgi:RNase P/RNase MRP subunit p30